MQVTLDVRPHEPRDAQSHHARQDAHPYLERFLVQIHCPAPGSSRRIHASATAASNRHSRSRRRASVGAVAAVVEVRAAAHGERYPVTPLEGESRRSASHGCGILRTNPSALRRAGREPDFPMPPANPRPPRWTEGQIERLLSRVRSLPGVTHAAAINLVPGTEGLILWRSGLLGAGQRGKNRPNLEEIRER